MSFYYQTLLPLDLVVLLLHLLMLQPNNIWICNWLAGNQTLLRIIPRHLLRITLCRRLFYRFWRYHLIAHHSLHSWGIIILLLFITSILNSHLLLFVFCISLHIRLHLTINFLLILLLVNIYHVSEEAGVLVVPQQIRLTNFPYMLILFYFSVCVAVVVPAWRSNRPWKLLLSMILKSRHL